MKNILLIIGFWAGFTVSGVTQGILLQAGDSYTYQFASLPFDHFSTVGSPAATFYILPFQTRPLGTTDILRIEMFENTPAGAPISSQTFTSASNPNDIGLVVPNAWGDRQGSIRLTMLSGSFRLDSFALAATVATRGGVNLYGEEITLAPEPSAVAMLTIGSGLVFGMRHSKNKRRISSGE